MQRIESLSRKWSSPTMMHHERMNKLASISVQRSTCYYGYKSNKSTCNKLPLYVVVKFSLKTRELFWLNTIQTSDRDHGCRDCQTGWYSTCSHNVDAIILMNHVYKRFGDIFWFLLDCFIQLREILVPTIVASILCSGKQLSFKKVSSAAQGCPEYARSRAT